MIDSIRVPSPHIILYRSGVALACGQAGELRAEELHGFFAGDTRVLSTYLIDINGSAWQLLGRSRSGYGTARWEFQNRAIRDAVGEIPAGTLFFGLRRRLDGGLHDDLQIRSYLARTVYLRLTLQLDADFADLFEVKDQSIPARMDVLRSANDDALRLGYDRADFRRGLHVWFSVMPTVSGSRLVFELVLPPRGSWDCCLEALPEIGDKRLRFGGNPHAAEPSPVPSNDALALDADPLLARPFARGVADLHALAVPQIEDPPFVAGGAPWFLTLFGRDPLMAALMTGLDGAWAAEGVLAALAPHQAAARDDFRDAEPGKLPHELRADELTQRRVLPYSPYYGTHDAPALYALALWHVWRWTGDAGLVERHLGTARKGLEWCDAYGDRDADGLQEYGTRSRVGYRNQGWKDAEDALVHVDGRQAEPPLATVELQGYLFAARLAMAELAQARGERDEARRLRVQARALRARVESAYWLDHAGFYAFALDRDKRPVESIASNPGHLLWCGLPGQERAARLASRLLAPDMFSGWGLRTLSADHPAYNPLSYQLGSVWPHDTAIAAAGLWRYGLRGPASVLLEAIMKAAGAFEEDRLPELFCGLDTDYGLPVPYEKANSPQAWAAAVPLLAAQLFLGLVPDAPRKRCLLAPALPDWLPHLAICGIRIGGERLDVSLVREGASTVVKHIESGALQVVSGAEEAPLWGVPPAVALRES